MGAIRDVSIGRKLYASFGLIVLLLISVAVGVRSTTAIRADADRVSTAATVAADASRLETRLAEEAA